MSRATPSRAVALPLLWALCVCAHAAAVKPAANASSPWQMAESAREQLQAMPAEQRRAADYRTVMDVYRLVYHNNPADVHAPDAIFQVASLLADQGTTLHDAKLLTAAIGQMEFLRTQYPHSSLRAPALLEEAHIAADRLHDARLARLKFAQYLEEYPHTAHAAEIQASLNQLGGAPSREPAAASARPPAEEHRSGAAIAATATDLPPAAADVVPAASYKGPTHSPTGLAYVSGIRHWSTPTYTRVAIDLGDEVKYEAARVPHPDRIYFDLHGTRLAHELFGKTFAVTDDGFLKRIRVAQYSDTLTRVVLDVNDVTEYSAFLLPNPYRLIIDIHGGSAARPSVPETALAAAAAPTASQIAVTAATAQPTASFVAQSASEPQLQAAPEASAPRTVRQKGESTVAAVPSTVAVRAASQREVAALSQQPDNQRATAQPTSQPIAVTSPAPAAADAPPPQATRTGTAPAKSRRNGRGTHPDSAGKADVALRAEPAPAAAPVHSAEPTADGQRSLVRALGLKIGRIVIDPGHGGHDSGTIGVGGIMEKDVVLDVALRLGKLLHEHLGADVIYTRSDDTFIPLETRTAIANKAEADLFLSIHANSSGDETARGVETYYLNFTSQPDALDVAARENAVSDQSVHQLADLVKKITLKDKIDESREFAADVDKALFDGLKRGNVGLKDRGVKKAPFVVLIGANMPSVLTEISFVTNGRDATQLATGEYRERVAESIYKGIARYTSGLSGVRVAGAPATADGSN